MSRGFQKEPVTSVRRDSNSMSTKSKPVITTKKLSKSYGDFQALKEVSLTVNKGDIYGLVGRNGAGKTTLFKCLMGLAKPTSGEMTIENSKTVGLNEARQHIGFMINPTSFSYLSPYDNLEYLSKIKGLNSSPEDINSLLKLVGLQGVKKPFKAFSMGMKQRLGIAGALLGNPEIVILDEPINGLDPQGINDIRKIIQDIHDQHGTTFIISSHILSELDLIATTYGFIEQGKLLQEISRKELHKYAQKTLEIQTGDIEKTLEILAKKFKITNPTVKDQTIIIDSHLDRTADIAAELVKNDIAIYDLHPQETTLEEYFINLIGGHDA